MKNTGNKLIALLVGVFLLAQIGAGQEKTPDIPDEKAQIELKEAYKLDSHIRMLRKLQIETQEHKETFERRGEIVFFISFGYIWMWQFIMYNQILPSVFAEGSNQTELEDRNFYFALASSLVLGLFVARNDLQHYHFVKKGQFYSYPGVKDDAFNRTRKGYNWYFNFFSWEF